MDYDHREVCRIKQAAGRIKEQSQVLLAIGIGGSYLGARAAIEMLKKYFNNEGVEVIFVGNQISGTYAADLLDYLRIKIFPLMSFQNRVQPPNRRLRLEFSKTIWKNVMVKWKRKNGFTRQRIKPKGL